MKIKIKPEWEATVKVKKRSEVNGDRKHSNNSDS